MITTINGQLENQGMGMGMGAGGGNGNLCEKAEPAETIRDSRLHLPGEIYITLGKIRYASDFDPT